MSEYSDSTIDTIDSTIDSTYSVEYEPIEENSIEDVLDNNTSLSTEDAKSVADAIRYFLSLEENELKDKLAELEAKVKELESQNKKLSKKSSNKKLEKLEAENKRLVAENKRLAKKKSSSPTKSSSPRKPNPYSVLISKTSDKKFKKDSPFGKQKFRISILNNTSKTKSNSFIAYEDVHESLDIEGKTLSLAKVMAKVKETLPELKGFQVTSILWQLMNEEDRKIIPWALNEA